jgi:signal peptidase II
MKRKWMLLTIVTAVGFFLDWFTKYLADTSLGYGSPVRVVGQYVQLMLIYNKGALFGFNPAEFIPFLPLNQFFVVFSFVAIGILIYYYRSIPRGEVLMHWGLAMILPGALGNLFDRIVRADKGVVDFIRVGISEEVYWPIFNLADAWVTIGVGLLLFAFITEENRRKKVSVQEIPEDKKSESKPIVNG